MARLTGMASMERVWSWYYYLVDLVLPVASIAPLKRVIELLAAALVGFVLSEVFAEGPRPSGVKIAAAFFATFVAVALYIIPSLPRRMERAWQRISVDLDEFSEKPSKKFPTDWDKRVVWKDISWLGNSRGWLSGAVVEGGGHDDVGVGVLLFSYGGPTWNLVSNEKFNSGEGEFTWGPRGTRLYRWSDVGPIYSILFYKGPALERGVLVEGWAATATGVYRSTDAGQTWLRTTPPPGSPERYAFFSGLAGVEGFAEVYATGWQGIAHWNPPTGWMLEKPAYYFNISAIAVVGGSENRSVWAVGRSGDDESGSGDKSHGAIYHLAWPVNRWGMFNIGNVRYEPGQGFNDLLADDHKILAVGDRGLIVLGTRNQSGGWEFRQIFLPTEVLPTKEHISLMSVAEHENIIYVVGQKGTILYSRDGGLHWLRSEKVTDADGNKLDLADVGLTRIRFFNGEGWILGHNNLVLRSVTLAGVT